MNPLSVAFELCGDSFSVLRRRVLFTAVFREIEPEKCLCARHIEVEAKIGKHGDGGGLSLIIAKDGPKRWIFAWDPLADGSDSGDRMRDCQKFRVWLGS